jgi:flagellar motor protein MotB
MKLGTSRGGNGNVDDENPYWISFSDIMAGLLVIFILASLVLILELLETKNLVKENIENLKESVEARNLIMDEIKQELEEKNILVELSDNKEVLRIPEDALAFETNRSRIPSSQKVQETVYEIGKILYERITIDNRHEKYLDTIFIEGHTDSRRSNRKGGNWRLSTDRAISIWRYWLEVLPETMKIEELKNHSDENLFSVSGYAETRRLIDVESSDSDYKKNRRIDIRITVKKPTIGMLEKTIKPVSGI